MENREHTRSWRAIWLKRKRKRAETVVVEDLLERQFCEGAANQTKTASSYKTSTTCSFSYLEGELIIQGRALKSNSTPPRGSAWEPAG